MKLLYKQMTKELSKNYLSLVLILLLVSFTSFIYFFVHFSVDGNIATLQSLPSLKENEHLYLNALHSNAILARNMLTGSVILTSFVFYIFYHRFMKKNYKSLACLKALGFKDSVISSLFWAFTFILSVLGGLLGLIAGYFASDLLLKSGMKSYQMSGLVKRIHISSFFIGIFIPAFFFCIISYLTYLPVATKETALLLSSQTDTSTNPFLLAAANKLANFYPGKNKLSVRLALRKPLALILIILAVTAFSVMFLLAYSLHLSSEKIYQSQILGHHYLYDNLFDKPRLLEKPLPNSMPYLNTSGNIMTAKQAIQQEVIAFKNNSPLFELMDDKGNMLPGPTSGEIVISPALRDLYDIKEGHQIELYIHNHCKTFTVSAIAFNAKLNSVYIHPSDLEEMLSLPPHSYTGIWSIENISDAAKVISRYEKMDELEKNFVSNRISAVINQLVGCLIGSILLFLALLLNFQDNTKDILILDLMGYQSGAIRKMLLDIYKPVIYFIFSLGLWPSMQIVRFILKSLSLQIGDYMPFQSNIFVIGGIFLLLNFIYFIVQWTFNLGINKIIKSDALYQYSNNE